MKWFSSSKSLWMVGVGMTVACAMMISCSQGPDHSPSQTVQRWLSLYPKDLVQAATITSWGMRDGLDAQKWIEKVKLTGGEFSYLGGDVLSEEITENTAKVIVDAKITSVLGEQRQREQFKLSIADNNTWVIDDRTVVMVLPNVPDFED